MIKILYNIFLLLFWLIKPIVMFFNSKFAKRERQWKKVLLSNLKRIENKGQRMTIWIHSASMGEFEQAKPLIEAIKSRQPDSFLVATFFSPSGYENQKNYPFADVLLYLPFDFWWQSKKFLKTIKPHIAIFIKYEFWLNYLVELKKRNIPTFLVAATEPFRGNNTFYRLFLVFSLKYFKKIFVSDEKDLEFYSKMNLSVPIDLVYDTRYDRVYSKIKSLDHLPFTKEDFGGKLVLVAGSVWEPDLELIFKVKSRIGNQIDLLIIYVPHEPTQKIVELIEKNDRNTVRYSNLQGIADLNDMKQILQSKNLIVDKVGLLLSLYSLGDVAYVGGGFGKGLHSVIEPAGYFLPIICGGNIKNSKDAVNLNEIGALFVVNDEIEFSDVLLKLRDDNFNKHARTKVKTYFERRIGATQKILDEVIKT